jgi:hypothetical protein
MTIWEKAVLNMQKGAKKIAAAAALFSERVKSEIAIARLRIRLGEVQSLIDEQYLTIGRTLVDLKSRSALPKTAEQLMKDDVIVAAIAEIEAREKEKEDLLAEMAGEQLAFKTESKQKETAS